MTEVGGEAKRNNIINSGCVGNTSTSEKGEGNTSNIS